MKDEAYIGQVMVPLSLSSISMKESDIIFVKRKKKMLSHLEEEGRSLNPNWTHNQAWIFNELLTHTKMI